VLDRLERAVLRAVVLDGAGELRADAGNLFELRVVGRVEVHPHGRCGVSRPGTEPAAVPAEGENPDQYGEERGERGLGRPPRGRRGAWRAGSVSDRRYRLRRIHGACTVGGIRTSPTVY